MLMLLHSNAVGADAIAEAASADAAGADATRAATDAAAVICASTACSFSAHSLWHLHSMSLWPSFMTILYGYSAYAAVTCKVNTR